MAKSTLRKPQKSHPKPDLKEIKADRKILIGEKGEGGRISSPWAFLCVCVWLKLCSGDAQGQI